MEIYRGRFGDLPLDSIRGALKANVLFLWASSLSLSHITTFFSSECISAMHNHRRRAWAGMTTSRLASFLLQLLCGRRLGKPPCRRCPACLVASEGLALTDCQCWQGIQRWPRSTSAFETQAQRDVTGPRAHWVSGTTR